MTAAPLIGLADSTAPIADEALAPVGITPRAFRRYTVLLHDDHAPEGRWHQVKAPSLGEVIRGLRSGWLGAANDMSVAQDARIGAIRVVREVDCPDQSVRFEASPVHA